MSLTVQQQHELRTLVAEVCIAQTSKNPLALQALYNFVDQLASARVVEFAQGALRANNVRAHCENTLAQYALLGLSGVGLSKVKVAP